MAITTLLLAWLTRSGFTALAKSYQIATDSEQRLALLMRSASDAIIALDAQNRIVFLNRSAERLLGATLQDGLKVPIADFVPQFQVDCERLQTLQARRANGGDFVVEVRSRSTARATPPPPWSSCATPPSGCGESASSKGSVRFSNRLLKVVSYARPS